MQLNKMSGLETFMHVGPYSTLRWLSLVSEEWRSIVNHITEGTLLLSARQPKMHVTGQKQATKLRNICIAEKKRNDYPKEGSEWSRMDATPETKSHNFKKHKESFLLGVSFYKHWVVLKIIMA